MSRIGKGVEVQQSIQAGPNQIDAAEKMVQDDAEQERRFLEKLSIFEQDTESDRIGENGRRSDSDIRVKAGYLSCLNLSEVRVV